MKKTYIIDGNKIFDLESFLAEFAKAVEAPNGCFGNDLAQFDDCLFGGFGLEAPCVIIWKNSELSKKRLSTQMLVDYYEKRLTDVLEESDTNEMNLEEVDPINQTIINNCRAIIKKALAENETLFSHITDLIMSVTKRALFSDRWIVELVLE